MDLDVQQKIAVTIDNYFPEMVEDYLDDHQLSIQSDIKNKKIPHDVLNLVVTLKHWANPFSSYQPQLSLTEFVNFKFLIEILRQPEKIMSQYPSFTDEDKAAIKLAVEKKLDQIADEVIEKYKLEKEVIKNLESKEDDLARWWKNQTPQQQEKIKKNFAQLTPREKVELRTIVTERQVVFVNDPAPDLFWLFWMSHYHQHFYWGHYHGIGAYPYLLPSFPSRIKFSHRGGYSSSNHSDYSSGCGGGGGYSSSNSGDSAADVLVTAGAIAGFIAIVSAGIIGATYAIKKACNSIYNVCTGNKMLRSLFRLSSITAGAVGGAYTGMMVGGLLGSLLPGLGTAAGIMIGGAAGAGLGGGLAALVSKYTAKGISYIFHSHDDKIINPTNPEKYLLSRNQKRKLIEKGFSVEGVEQMIIAIRREKLKLGWTSSFFWTAERKKKNAWNDMLDKIKNHPEKLSYPIKIGSLDYDPSPSRFDFQKPTVVSSTAQYMQPTFGDNLTPPANIPPPPVNVQPSAPPLEDVSQVNYQPTYPTVESIPPPNYGYR